MAVFRLHYAGRVQHNIHDLADGAMSFEPVTKRGISIDGIAIATPHFAHRYHTGILHIADNFLHSPLGNAHDLRLHHAVAHPVRGPGMTSTWP